MSDSTATHVLIIEPDEATAAYLAQMLTQNGYRVSKERTGKEGLISIYRERPGIIITELILPDIDGCELVAKIKHDPRIQRAHIIALTSLTEPEITQRATEAGIDEFVIKQADAMDVLQRYLKHHDQILTQASTMTAPIRPGRIITFLSSKGGAGTSTLCLNLSNHMSLIDPNRQIGVLDLVLPIGALGHITGLEAQQPDIIQLAQLPPEDLTPKYLRAHLPSPTSWGFQLIPGAKGPNEAVLLEADRLNPILQTLRSTYGLLVVDVGRNLSPLTISALALSDLIVMVINPDPVAAANARTILSYLETQQIPGDRVYTILNRPHMVEGLTPKEFEKLEIPILNTIANLNDRLFLTNRLHIPLHMRFPEDTAVYSFKEIAGTLLNLANQKTEQSY